MTRHSLFAKHNLEEFFIEFKVGFNPAIPTIEATEISTFLLVHSITPSSPATTFIFLPNKLFFKTLYFSLFCIATIFGFYRKDCLDNKLTLFFDDNEYVENLVLFFFIISTVFEPIEPVDPRIEIVFKDMLNNIKENIV